MRLENVRSDVVDIARREDERLPVRIAEGTQCERDLFAADRHRVDLIVHGRFHIVVQEALPMRDAAQGRDHELWKRNAWRQAARGGDLATRIPGAQRTPRIMRVDNELTCGR